MEFDSFSYGASAHETHLQHQCEPLVQSYANVILYLILHSCLGWPRNLSRECSAAKFHAEEKCGNVLMRSCLRVLTSNHRSLEEDSFECLVPSQHYQAHRIWRYSETITPINKYIKVLERQIVESRLVQ